MDKQKVISRLKSLQMTYRPNPDVIRQLSHINLIAVAGPTGAGKSTVTRQTGLPFVVGDTTRAPREGEVHGRDYNFRVDHQPLLEEVERGEFAQFVIERETEFYGTKASSFPGSGVCVMSIIASSMPRFMKLGFGSVIPVYVVPPNNSEWMRRIAAHHEKDLEARLQEAKESLTIALNDPQYIFIMNDELPRAVEAMRQIASGSIDHTASSRARNSATTVLDQLQKAIK
jgi:guanylate kinase